MLDSFFSIKRPVKVGVLLVYLSLVAALSLMPSEDLPDIGLFTGFDKLIHVVMYSILSWLLCWTFNLKIHNPLNFIFIFFAVIWGVTLEFLQLKMNFGRSFEWYDILANIAGSFMGVIIFNLISGGRTY